MIAEMFCLCTMVHMVQVKCNHGNLDDRSYFLSLLVQFGLIHSMNGGTYYETTL